MIFLNDDAVLPINALVTALISFFVGVPAIFITGFIFNVYNAKSIKPTKASNITGLLSTNNITGDDGLLR